MLAFEGMLTVESYGHSGGVALLLRNKDEVVLNSLSKNHIDVVIKAKGGLEYRLTGIYGEPDRSKRKETWDLIRRLSTDYTLPWCLIGDMNNVLSQNDKRGGRPYPQYLLQGFQAVLNDCELTDMDLCGYQYTWERGSETDNSIEVRLDRALVNQSFLSMFTNARLTNLEVSTSDHCPLWLEPQIVVHLKVTKFFHFENAWLREPMCYQLVDNVWNHDPNRSFFEKILQCSEVLSAWGKEVTGSFKTRIHRCKKVLKTLKGRRDTDSLKVVREEKKNLSEIYAQQEVFWRQRSKQLWLREGDQNCKFFHLATKKRRKANQINFLHNASGEKVEWGSGLEETITGYFSNLFTATETEWERVISCVSRKVSAEQNVMLLAEVDEKEVKAALFNMHPEKSPGPDGMSPGFYQKCWPIVKDDVVKLVKQFFITGAVNDQLKSTNIALIPKKQNPVVMTDLRPISLCNVIYKVISKVLANRLKQVLDNVISDTQSAFIPGRLITDNIMVAFEVIHYMKRKTRGKEAWMALKLDMSKAYDRVEWSFLQAILLKLGFDHKVVDLFISCISSVTYQISHAGRRFGEIVPTRGLRQGDPLSSYLFLTCMEGLTALINDYEEKNFITGIKVARSAPPISHMFFADDSYIFCKASLESANHVLQMLSLFEKASGQQLNVDKSSILFSNNTCNSLKQDLCHKLMFKEASDRSLYLGLPNVVGRNKSSIFGYIKDKMVERIESWDKKTLSKGGKEVLLKTVAQSFPIFAMSVFLLPLHLCQDLEKLMCKFWWKSNSQKERSIHWQSWSNMSKKKSEGGMGFRNVRDFNVALLGKQGWRLLKYPDKLVSRVFKARYYPEGSFLNAKIGSNPSYIWRSVLESQSILKQGVGCRVGSGRNINIIEDPWLSEVSDPYIHTRNDSIQNQKVSSLLEIDSNSWDEELINDVFDSRDASLILSIPLNNDVEDTWYWRREKLGNYTVKSAYLMIQESKTDSLAADNSGFWRKLWNLKIPPKVKNFLWRASSNCLPTKDLLRQKQVQISALCPVCNDHNENTFHSLVSCSFATSVWSRLNLSLIVGEFNCFPDWLQLVFDQQRLEDVHLIVMVCWMMWKNRNDLVWNQHCLDSAEVLESATSVLNQWRSVQDKTFDRFMGYMTQEDGEEHWYKPQINSVKINTDAAIFKESDSYSYVFVVRDHDGSLVEAKARCRRGSISPDLAEALGIREALSWLKNTNYANAVVESDCLQVVQAIQSSFICFSYLGRVVSECRNLLVSLSDKNVSFNFVKRSANKVAHYLARYNYSIADRSWRVGDVHPEFHYVLLKDLSEQ
ncbi:hypothetical protein AgCh_024870 [Apium graveolens]